MPMAVGELGDGDPGLLLTSSERLVGAGVASATTTAPASCSSEMRFGGCLTLCFNCLVSGGGSIPLVTHIFVAPAATWEAEARQAVSTAGADSTNFSDSWQGRAIAATSRY